MTDSAILEWERAFLFLPEGVRPLALRSAETSKRATWRKGDPTDYHPFAGSWELSAGLVKLLEVLPRQEARQAALVLWTALADGRRRLAEANESHAREVKQLLARIDALNEHIDHLGGP